MLKVIVRSARILGGVLVAVVLSWILPAVVSAAAVGMGPDTSWGSLDPAAAQRTVDLERAAGVEFAREGAGWAWAQPRPGEGFSPEWERALDRIIERDLDAGITPVLLISHPPYWASADPAKYTDATGEHWHPYYKPNDLGAFAAFVRHVVERYSRMGVRHYEIWNEPNLESFWPSGVDAADYVRLLNVGFRAAHDADPDAIVISGGLSNVANAYDYAEQMYAAGARFDRFGYHVYPTRDPAECWKQDGRESLMAFCTIAAIRDVMVDNGDQRKGIWLTELGFSSCNRTLHPVLYRALRFAVSRVAWINAAEECFTEQQQADYLLRSYQLLERDYPYIDAALWGNFRNIPQGPWSSWFTNIGVLNADFSEKPAYAAMRRYATGEP